MMDALCAPGRGTGVYFASVSAPSRRAWRGSEVSGAWCQAPPHCDRDALLRIEDSSLRRLGRLARMFFIIKCPLGVEQVDESRA